MSKHTPGPWRVVDTGRIFVYASDNSECPIARIERAPGDANARLIAAAPELLEVLKDAGDELHDFPNDGRNAEYDQLLKRIRAAIAKAEGK